MRLVAETNLCEIRLRLPGTLMVSRHQGEVSVVQRLELTLSLSSQAMRHMGADLEELMMMEAVRRSLQDLSTSDDQPEQQPGPADPADPPAESAAGPSEDTSPAADTPHSDTDGTAGSSDSEGNGHDATQNGRTVAKTAVVPGLRVNFADDDPSSPVVEAFMDNADETGA